MLRGACAHCTPPLLEARRVTAALVSTRAFFLISEVAKALYVREVTEKTAEFEPRARVVRVDWQESDVVRGEVIPKVVYELV